MAFNGSGTFQRLYSWVTDAANGILVRADRMDQEMDGMANGLSTCLTKDGQTQPTSNLPMNGFKHINVSDATAANHYASLGQIAAGTFNWAGASTGTGTAYVVTTNPAVTINSNGRIVRFTANVTSTSTTPTLTLGTAPAGTLVRSDGSPLSIGQIVNGTTYEVLFDGTNWRVMNSFNSVAGDFSVTGNETVVGTSTAASFIPTGSTVPTNGLYLAAAGNPAIAAAGVKHWDMTQTVMTVTGVDNNDAQIIINKPGGGTGAPGVYLQKNGANTGAFYNSGTDYTFINYSSTGGINFYTNNAAALPLAMSAAGIATFANPVVASNAIKAWVYFTVSGGTVTVRSSVNVSSVVRNSTGTYTINFTNALPSTNYGVKGTLGAISNNSQSAGVAVANTSSAPILKTTTQVQVYTVYSSTITDAYENYFEIMGS